MNSKSLSALLALAGTLVLGGCFGFGCAANAKDLTCADFSRETPNTRYRARAEADSTAAMRNDLKPPKGANGTLEDTGALTEQLQAQVDALCANHDDVFKPYALALANTQAYLNGGPGLPTSVDPSGKNPFALPASAAAPAPGAADTQTSGNGGAQTTNPQGAGGSGGGGGSNSGGGAGSGSGSGGGSSGSSAGAPQKKAIVCDPVNPMPPCITQQQHNQQHGTGGGSGGGGSSTGSSGAGGTSTGSGSGSGSSGSSTPGTSTGP